MFFISLSNVNLEPKFWNKFKCHAYLCFFFLFFLHYSSHLCPPSYVAGLGSTVLILGIRGLWWITDWCGNSWVNEKLEDVKYMENWSILRDTTLRFSVSVAFSRVRWERIPSECGQTNIKRARKHHVSATQRVSKCGKFNSPVQGRQCWIWPRHPVAYEYAELVYLLPSVCLGGTLIPHKVCAVRQIVTISALVWEVNNKWAQSKLSGEKIRTFFFLNVSLLSLCQQKILFWAHLELQ